MFCTIIIIIIVHNVQRTISFLQNIFNNNYYSTQCKENYLIFAKHIFNISQRLCPTLIPPPPTPNALEKKDLIKMISSGISHCMKITGSSMAKT